MKKGLPQRGAAKVKEIDPDRPPLPTAREEARNSLMGDAPQTASAQDIDFCDPEPFEVDAKGQHLTLYPAGADRRRALIELTEGARTSLKVVFYIFAEDEVSTEFRDAMVRAAKRGVDVTLIIDRFGAAATDEFLKPLTDAGGTFCCFSPRKSQRYLIRNHQKMVIADDELAMFGGFNIEDDYFAPPENNGWNDIAIKVRGTAVDGLVEWFERLHDWTKDDDANFRAIRKTVKSWDWSDGDVHWLVGGPTRGLSTWAKCVSQDLMEGERLDMFMAYFSPPRRLLKRIGKIAQKGETRLLMAGKSDNGATLGATRSLYSYLLGKGAKIWEFAPCKLHTKLIVLDDTVYLGSANFDMRSLYLNLEIVMKVDDAAFADRMREFVTEHIGAAEAITPEVHKQRATLTNRIKWNLGWLLVSVIDYTVSRRLNLGI